MRTWTSETRSGALPRTPGCLGPDERAWLKARLVAEAAVLGFCAVGVCRPDAIPEAAGRLRAFLAEGRHGTMGWMAEREGWRGSPARLWPEARSVVMLADSYAPSRDPREAQRDRSRGAVSVYARGRDYHDSVKPRLKRLLRWLLAEAPGHEGKVFVDTAPVMEKPLGQAAGIGWQGKHTNLLGRAFGNWAFLGAILTTLDLAPDEPEGDHCGSCRACLDACPTAAFPAPYLLDARRCLSYLTIEHHGPWPEAFREALGNRVFGCDDCLAACPWNKFAAAASEMRYAPDRANPPLAELLALDDAGFRARFAGTPVKRIGVARFLRNCLYAAGNAGDASLRAAVAAHLASPDPVVAEAARWAHSRLRDPARLGGGATRP